ncbi:hypothetical protein V5O48_018658, partial [Marasmius crinis-equi]
YLPLPKETGYVPTKKYALAVEIRNYLAEVAQKWGLTDKILFRTSVDSLCWDNSSRSWKVDLMTSGVFSGAQVKLKGKHVGIIGTGASAIQSIPELANSIQERTEAHRPKGVASEDHFKGGWHKERMENQALFVAESLMLTPDTPNLVNDGWSHVKGYRAIVGSESFENIGPKQIPQHVAQLLALDKETSEQVRA